ncbi:unnamed protein product [Taenia asiatica]|uniref:Zinc finger protein n=1 Tax=Taenia asiatica TaxID=60517 RepID=A0A158R8A4_TAEAS|nr:unnamed protein product [Taenia asiatica]
MELPKSDKQAIPTSALHVPKPEESFPESTHPPLNQTPKGMGNSSEAQDSGIGASQSSSSFSELSSLRKSPQLTGTLRPNNFSTPLNSRDVAMPLTIPEENISEIAKATSSVASTSARLSASTSASTSVPTNSRGPRHRQKKNRICSYCGKTFDRPSLLRRHILSHTGERPFPCQYCDKAFSTRSGANTHERTHTGYKPYICRICGRRFAAGSNYIFHIYTHTNTRRHRCDICTKAFVTPGDLRRHKYVHTEDWPFRCSVCNRGFAVERSLISHKAIHTGEFSHSNLMHPSGVKPYPCRLCNKSYTQESSLKTHMRLHQRLGKPVKTPSTSDSKILPQPLGCLGQQPIQQTATNLNEVPLPEAPYQTSVFRSLSFWAQYFSASTLLTQLQPSNPNPSPDGDSQVQELQQQLSHLRMHSTNEALTTSSRSAFVDLRRQQTPSSSRHLLPHPSSNLSSHHYNQRRGGSRPVSPEQDQPIDLSTKKGRR